MKKSNWYFIIYIICIALATLAFFKMEPDYLWHIKAGEYMFNHGLLTKDVFSWSVYGKYWMSHEWLFEIIIYSLKMIFGNYHLVIYCATCLLFLMFSLYFFNKKQINNNIIFAIIWFINFLIISPTVQVRPHLISYCLLSLTIYFLYDLYKNEESKKIYFLPIISIIWANVHGGSSNMPYLLCFIFIIAGLFKFSFSKIEAKRLSKKQFIKYGVVMLLCILAVFINLHGYKMFLYPYQNMMNKVMLANIMEWQPTSLNKLSHYVYFALLIVIVIIMLFSKKKIEFMDFILLGFCAFLGLKSIRFWVYTYIIMTYVIFYYLGKRKPEPGLEIGLVFVSIVLPILFFSKDHSIFTPDYKYLLNKEDIDFLEKEGPKRLYNNYNFGGELVYNNIKVFIDGRADLYSEYNYQDYLNICSLEGDYVSLIKKYDFDYFLVEPGYPISTYLRYNRDYKIIYGRDNVLIYQKIKE